jgi:dihydrofolate synthase/folylpolyglutamate synthase
MTRPSWPDEVTAPLTYEQALAYLFHTARYDGRGLKYQHPERSQQRMRELLAALGNPHERFRSIHITGTKGKGSTSAFTESVLRHAGYRTGLFTSPHLHSFRERIRCNGQLIPATDLAELIRELRPFFEEIPDLTVFDKITAIAFQYFALAGVDWAVVEVGLGGRLDSTNVILPEVCGITRISKDHTHVLGNTLEKIAFEKAGIIKPGVPVFISPQRPSAYAVIERVARERGAPLTQVKPVPPAHVPLRGRHQRINAAIALGMLQDLIGRGMLRDDPQALLAGMEHTVWPGRFEALPQPSDHIVPLLVDCAHNVDSINVLLEALEQYYPGQPVTFIFGANRDKALQPILERLLAVSPRIIVVSSHHPKALSPDEICAQLEPLAAAWEKTGRKMTAQMARTMTDALAIGGEITPAGGLMVGTGSVFVVAELREAWQAQYPGVFPPGDWVYEAPGEPSLT